MFKNHFFLIAMLLFGCSLSAQKAFFIKPRVMMKTTRSHYLYEGFFQHMNQVNYAANDYYTFVNNGYHFSNSKINWGVSAGIRLDNKNSLELVFSADGSSVSNSFVYYSFVDYGQPAYSFQNFGHSIWGRDFKRLNIEYNRVFFHKPLFSLRSNLGVGVFFQNQRTEVFNHTMGNDQFSANITERNINYSRIATIFQFGLGIDFLTKRSIPIFSLDVFVTLNFKTNVQSVLYDVEVFDLNTSEIHHFKHDLHSRGSGINFQLSRPIQVHPWRPNKKPKTAL